MMTAVMVRSEAVLFDNNCGLIHTWSGMLYAAGNARQGDL